MRPAVADIRPAASADVEAIRRLVERAYSRWVPIVGLRPGPMDADYDALVGEANVFVGEVDVFVADSVAASDSGSASASASVAPAVVGVLVLRPDGGALVVENVAVDPDHQGRGLGPVLLEFAEERARARGIGELRLFTHERMADNIELYRRLGWEEYERRPSDGFSRVFFRKRVVLR